jgi:hypothetical protein
MEVIMKSTQSGAAPEPGHPEGTERSEHGERRHHGGHGHDAHGRGFGPRGDGFGGRGRGFGGRGRGFGRPGGWQQADLPDAGDAAAWFAGRLPADWFVGAPTVVVDREELTVIGELAAPELADTGASESDAAAQSAAAAGRASRFREDTREERIQIAQEAQSRYGRSVAWGVRIGDELTRFSQLAVPVMTRLRQSERQVLDTLIDAGVARSRADALVWTVKLVGENSAEWLTKLRAAMADVDTLRTEGPQ